MTLKKPLKTLGFRFFFYLVHLLLLIQLTMKHLSLSTVLFTISFLSFGQCPTTSITLSSQADVDNFTTNYPGCTELQNSLAISGINISDLSPLPQLSLKYLYIYGNDILENLDGLEITIVNDVMYDYSEIGINNNPVLTDISSLSSTITPATEPYAYIDVNIINNPMLASLNGMDFLEYSTLFYIRNNDSLVNLSGLDNLLKVGDFFIDQNDNLLSLVGLDSIDWIYENFYLNNNNSLQSLTGFNPNYYYYETDTYIFSNPLLTDISVMDNWTVDNSPTQQNMSLNIYDNVSLSLCNNFTICLMTESLSQYPNIIDIHNNASGCNSIAQVAQSCGLVPSNDECSSAIDITVGETIEAYNDLATASAETPSCNDIDRADVWFTFNSGDLDLVSVLVEDGYNIQLWEGTCGSLTQVPDGCDSGNLWGVPVTTNTDYYVQVWSCAGCRMASMATGLFNVLVLDGILSTNEVALATVELFPNPVKNSLTINSSHEISKIEVYNLLGQRMLQTSANTLETELDLAALKSGMYLVKVYSLGSEQTFKVLKE